MRFFPVACFICCAVASVWTVSRASHWLHLDADTISSATLEAFLLSRCLSDLEMEYANVTGMVSDSIQMLATAMFGPDPPLSAPAEPEAELDPRFVFSARRHNIAFNPVYFDDIYSIDKRGNTLHFVDDATSIAKVSYPIFSWMPLVRRSVVQLWKLALPVSIAAA